MGGMCDVRVVLVLGLKRGVFGNRVLGEVHGAGMQAEDSCNEVDHGWKHEVLGGLVLRVNRGVLKS